MWEAPLDPSSRNAGPVPVLISCDGCPNTASTVVDSDELERLRDEGWVIAAPAVPGKCGVTFDLCPACTTDGSTYGAEWVL